MPDIIAVLDFGSQYTQVIARRIREADVLSRIYPYNTKVNILKKEGVKGIILSGGPSSVLLAGSPRPDKDIFQRCLFQQKVGLTVLYHIYYPLFYNNYNS